MSFSGDVLEAVRSVKCSTGQGSGMDQQVSSIPFRSRCELSKNDRMLETELWEDY